MPQIPVKEPSPDGEFTLIPDGEVVNAGCADLRHVPSSYENDDGTKKMQFEWDFVVTEDGPWLGTKVRAWTSDNFVAHPNCKAYVWAKAITRLASLVVWSLVIRRMESGIGFRMCFRHGTRRLSPVSPLPTRHKIRPFSGQLPLGRSPPTPSC